MVIRLLRVSAILAIVLAFSGLYQLIQHAHELVDSTPIPEVNALSSHTLKSSSQVLDRNDDLLTSIDGPAPRLYYSVEDFPEQLKNAVLAIEDRHFYRHSGVSLADIARAIQINLLAGKIVQGASTITQQVARLLFLNRERTFSRKINEMILAVVLDAKWPKNKILEVYLNRVFLGNHSYGFAMASQRYFSKPIEELSLSELAILAGLPKAPSNYAPHRHYDRALNRRDQVLKAMFEHKVLEHRDYLSAVKSRPKVSRRFLDSRNSFFIQSAQKEARELLGAQRLSGKGLKIETSFSASADRHLQSTLKFIDTQLPDNRYPSKEIELSGLSLYVPSGEVLAEQGSRNFQLSQFNRIRQMRRRFPRVSVPIMTHHALSQNYHFGFKPQTNYPSLFQDFCFGDTPEKEMRFSYWGPRLDFNMKQIGMERDFVLSKGKTELTLMQVARMFRSIHPLETAKQIHRVTGIRDASHKQLYKNKKTPKVSLDIPTATKTLLLGWRKCSEAWGQGRYWSNDGSFGYVGYDDLFHNAFAVYFSEQNMSIYWIGSERGRIPMNPKDIGQIFVHVFERLKKAEKNLLGAFSRQRLNEGISWVPFLDRGMQKQTYPVPTKQLARIYQQNRAKL